MHQDLHIANSDFLRDVSPHSDGCNSPRSKIARKLDCLDLDQDDASHRNWTHSPKKRTRLSSEEVAGTQERSSVLSEATIPATDDFTIMQTISDVDGNPALQGQARITHFMQASKSTRMRSPPPPLVSGEKAAMLAMQEGAVHTGSTTSTWQAFEITGMAVDLAAGDDGEGIHGIAFRPSPQVAYARRQKRKQQLSEWKAREAREARVRRFERRNGCKLQAPRDSKRSVRFVNDEP